MNPDTNKFEALDIKEELKKVPQRERVKKQIDELESKLVRPNGEPVPKSWTIFTVGELVKIKNYTFRVAYIGESNILFEPEKPEDVLKEMQGNRQDRGS